MTRRNGTQTCCYECARQSNCREGPSKIRNTCTFGPKGLPNCAMAQVSDFCLVCPTFKGQAAPDPNQTTMFADK